MVVPCATWKRRNKLLSAVEKLKPTKPQPAKPALNPAAARHKITNMRVKRFFEPPELKILY